MAILYDSKNMTWKIDTMHTSYVMGVVDDKYLAHLYYGKRIDTTDLRYLLRPDEVPAPSIRPDEKLAFMDNTPFEYPCQNMGDFREACLAVRNNKGQIGCDLVYKSYKIEEGKQGKYDFPESFGDNAKTLTIVMEDELTKIEVSLKYTVFDDSDVIVRSSYIRNNADAPVYLERALSGCLDVETEDYDVITMTGAWAREHIVERTRLKHSAAVAESLRGEEGHDAMPFMALVSHNTDQKHGEVYASQLIYSGNFLAKAKMNSFESARFVMGINPETFTWKLEKGDEFRTPEAVYIYTPNGLGDMTRCYHDFYRNHLISPKWVHKERPILINNWEATYFDFDKDKLLSIGEEASKHGIELQVLDDGWFGYNRNQPTGGLGDWFVNDKKIEGGLTALTDGLNKIGMKFGLWFEPEMICRETKLYKEHPEWVLHLEGRVPALARDQWVLDYSNPKVREYIYESMAKILREIPVIYVKWDMNRALCDVGSNYLPVDRQGEICHRHVLGVYEIQGRLLQEFPYLLIENCSSGGARFDGGMLYYSPQIWCSDDMDPIERLSIQEGTAMLYPVSSIGAHVCKSPNDTTGRRVSFESRALAAMFGTFGYELDITKIDDKEKNAISDQIKRYKSIRHLVLNGDYYRISSYRENGVYDCTGIVSKDKKEAMVLYMQVLSKPNSRSRRLKLEGLDENLTYEADGQKYTGGQLMYAGINMKKTGDFETVFLHIKSV